MRTISLTIILFAAVPAFSQADRPSAQVDVKAEIKNLKGDDVSAKLSAITNLSAAGDKAAVSALIKQFKSEKNPLIKARIADSFRGLKDEKADAELINALRKDPSPDVRYSAARTLAYTAAEKAVPVLMEAFLDEAEQPGVRMQAAAALENYGGRDDIFECFEKALNSPEPKIRAQAVVSISRRFAGNRKAEATLERMSGDSDEKVAKTAKKRLELLKGKPTKGE